MDERYVFQITGLNAEQRDRLYNLYCNLPEEQKLIVETSVPEFVKQNNIFRHLGIAAEFHYSCRLIAIKSFSDNMKGIPSKLKPKYAESYLLTQARIDHVCNRPRRHARKNSAIAAREEEINFLYKERLSWPQISEYAAKHWNLRVSANYLRKVFLLLKGK